MSPSAMGLATAPCFNPPSNFIAEAAVTSQGSIHSSQLPFKTAHPCREKKVFPEASAKWSFRIAFACLFVKSQFWHPVSLLAASPS